MTDERDIAGVAARARIVASRLRRFQEMSRPAAESGWVPAWSSYLLENAVAELMSAPRAQIGDVLRGMWDALGESGAVLTMPMSHFIKDLVIHCFTRYRASYDATDLTWMSDAVIAGCTEAQTYLAMYALPEDAIRGSKDAILARFRGTTREAEAERQLG